MDDDFWMEYLCYRMFEIEGSDPTLALGRVGLVPLN